MIDKQELIEKLKDVATIEFQALEEDTPVRGNAMDGGDGALDKQVEDEIIARLNRCDIYSWFIAKVTARYGFFSGRDYLGGCSYDSEEQFKISGYYEDMRDAAIADLAQQIIETHYQVSVTLDALKVNV